jgi:hypothetical protein
MHPGTNTYAYVFHIEIYIVSIINNGLNQIRHACYLIELIQYYMLAFIQQKNKISL